MANQELNQDEFVDLYEALDLPQNADEGKIRKRINALYLESQQNLDHRNPKKRLHYQQLYEILLPQARHLLLDAGRRAEYDRYLTAFQTGTKVQTSAEEAQHRFETTRQVTVTERLKEEEGVDPAKLAEQREDMWAKWKMGLEQVEEEPAPQTETALPQTPAPASQTPAPKPAPAPEQPTVVQPAVVADQVTPPRRGFNEAAISAGTARRVSPDVKRQQDQKKMEIIERVAKTAMLIRAIMTGGITLAISCVILYFATNYLTSAGILTGTIGEIANLGWIPLALVIAFVQGRSAGESARQDKITELSRFSYEDLKNRY